MLKRGEYSKRRTCEASFNSEEEKEKGRSFDRGEERSGERASTQCSSVLFQLASSRPHPYPLTVQPPIPDHTEHNVYQKKKSFHILNFKTFLVIIWQYQQPKLESVVGLSSSPRLYLIPPHPESEGRKRGRRHCGVVKEREERKRCQRCLLWKLDVECHQFFYCNERQKWPYRRN